MSDSTSISILRQAVRDARTSEQRSMALDLVLRAIVPASPDMCEIWSLAGRLYRDNGDTKRALEAFAEGDVAGTGAEPAWICAEHAKLLLESGSVEKAVERARRGIASGQSSPTLLTVLGQALIKSQVAISEAESVVREAILSNPANRPLVEDWFDRLRQETSYEAASAWLEACQDASPTLLSGILSVLASLHGYAKVRTRFSSRLKALEAQEPYAQFMRVWRALMDDRNPAETDLAITARSPQKVELFFRFFQPSPEQAPLFADPAAERRLTELGVRIEALRAFVTNLKTARNPLWRRSLDDETIAAKRRQMNVWVTEDEGAVTDRVIETGTLAIIDPFTEQPVDLFDSCIMFGRTVYGYRGRELFYLICGETWSAVLGIYVPRYNLSITFESRGSGLMNEKMANTLAVLLTRYARYRPILSLPQPQGCSREVVLAVPAPENFAHHVWNAYSAIERLIVTDQIRHVSKVIFSGTEFFGPLEELFPELVPVGVERPPKSNIIDPFPFDPKGLVLPAGGFFVLDSLTRRMIDAMRRRPRVSHNVPEPDDYPQAARVPVFWFGLRLRDKVWVNQEQGITELIRVLAREHPDALFLLDGFSYPVGIDLISIKWSDVITELRAIGERIKTSSGAFERVVNMVGNTFRESVLWAQVTDVYLTPSGSTQHKVGWFSKAKGLVYVPKTMLTEEFEPFFRKPACYAVDYSPAPEFIITDAISAGARSGSNRKREHFANVDFDTGLVADRLSLLVSLPDRRPHV